MFVDNPQYNVTVVWQLCFAPYVFYMQGVSLDFYFVVFKSFLLKTLILLLNSNPTPPLDFVGWS